MSVRVLTGHVIDVLKGMAPQQFQVAVCSPPYWSLRNYGTEPQVWPDECGWGVACQTAHDWGEECVRAGSNAHRNEGFNERWGNSPGARVQEQSQPDVARLGAFCTRCHAWRGELGSEPTVELFISHLVQVFREVRRVLRDDGTLWVNLAGCYFNNPGGRNGGANNTLDYGAGRISAKAMEANRQSGRQDRTGRAGKGYWLKPLDYVDVPGLFAHAMQRDGWLWRSDMALVKAAPMPESVSGTAWVRCRVKVAKGEPASVTKQGEHPNRTVAGFNERYFDGVGVAEWADCPGCAKCDATDGLVLRRGNGRPTRAWERLLVFAKQEGYYFDTEGVREPHAEKSFTVHTTPRKGTGVESKGEKFNLWLEGEGRGRQLNPAGRNLRDWAYWQHETLKESHYASYPTFIPRLACLAGASRAGACATCGAAWARVVETDYHKHRPSGGMTSRIERGNRVHDGGAGSWGTFGTNLRKDVSTLAWRPTCRCPDAGAPVPQAILDPFVGSGTTLKVAQSLGLDGTGIDLQPTYVDIAERRLVDGYSVVEKQDGELRVVQRDLFSLAAGSEGGD